MRAFLLSVCTVTLLLGAGPDAIAQAYSVGNAAQGKIIAEAKCATCHGADGNSPTAQFPKLAGQNPAYLYWQLWEFRRGARSSDVMSPVVTPLSDAEMADAAAFYATQMIRPDPVTDSRLASAGEHVFFTGAGPGMMSACAMCHGSAAGRGMSMMGRMPMMGMMGHGMMGMMANIPKLNGQHAAYILHELDEFASGERRGTMMNRIAAGLSEADKKAVAEFLSGVR